MLSMGSLAGDTGENIKFGHDRLLHKVVNYHSTRCSTCSDLMFKSSKVNRTLTSQCSVLSSITQQQTDDMCDLVRH